MIRRNAWFLLSVACFAAAVTMRLATAKGPDWAMVIAGFVAGASAVGIVVREVLEAVKE